MILIVTKVKILVVIDVDDVAVVHDAAAAAEDDDDAADIYIMMNVCLSVTKNHHFLLGVSCDHLNYP